MHSTGTGQPVETQDVFFWRLAGRSTPTGLAIVHWIGSINAIKISIQNNVEQSTSGFGFDSFYNELEALFMII